MTQRHGQPWLPAEEARLTAGFIEGISTMELAKRHERGKGAIRSRLERLGLVEIGSSPSAASIPIIEEPELRENPLSRSIDRLIAALLDLKGKGRQGQLGRSDVAAVTHAYDRVDALLMTTVAASTPPEDEEQIGDPLPDRLREALAGLVRACVPDLTDRYIAVRLLGLEGDGERITLAQLGLELERSAERIRQRRKRAFRSINAALPRRIASSARLRAVLADVAADAEWTDPTEAAHAVVRLINSHVMTVKQLTLMVIMASGATGQIASLRRAADQAAIAACQDPDLLGQWRLDRWSDAAEMAILHGPAVRFDTPPDDMIGLKRAPAERSKGEAIPMRSDKLGRVVACESGMEMKVFTWLERSDEVRWYQEQPIAVPYLSGGRDRLYYPDAVVWDREGRIFVIEVKPVFNMFRRLTLEKALAAIDHLQPRGIGYLLVDSSGRTLADLAGHPYDISAAEEVEILFAQGAAPFRVVRDILSKQSGRFDFGAFVSMAVNRDWAVTEMPVTLYPLPTGLSFRPLLGLG